MPPFPKISLFVCLSWLSFSLTSHATLSISSITTPPADLLIDNTGSFGGSTRVTSGNSKGQSLLLSTDTQMDGIILNVNSVNTLGDITLSIFTTSGGFPSGDPVFTDSGSLPNGLTGGDYLQIDFTSTLELEADAYALVLESTTSDLQFSTNFDNYVDGTLIRNNSQTNNTWQDGGNASADFNFGIIGNVVDPNARPQASSGPNIIFILVDDMGWTDHSVEALALGNPSDYIQTPQLQRLADEGVAFTSAYVQPNCAPTRAVLMSGQYSCRTGNGVYNVGSLNRAGGRTTYTNAANQGDDFINGDTDTITQAEAMWNNGYVTAHFGKYHVGSSDTSSDTSPLNQGFDYNYGGNSFGHPGSFFALDGSDPREFHNGRVGPELDPYAADYTSEYITEHLLPVANGNDPTTLVGTRKHLTDAMGDAFIDFMDTHRTGLMSDYPVFIQFHMYAVHTPIQPRPDLQAKYQGLPRGTKHDGAGYAALTEHMDQTVGRLLNYLSDPNSDGDTADSIADDTLVIFISDNGGTSSQTDNSPLRGDKGNHYEGGIRVPLVFRMPGTIPAGLISDTLIHGVDFYPTLLDFAGASYPDPLTHPLDGESIYSHVLDPVNTARNRSPIFYHFPGYMDNRAYPSSAIIEDIDGKRYKYIQTYDPYYEPGGGAIGVLDQYQLYNLTDDISETVNLLDYIDVENASDPDDTSDSSEYWNYLLYRDIANHMAMDLHDWLEGTPGDSTWSPLQVTYASNYPDIDPSLVGELVPYASEALPTISIPINTAFRISDLVAGPDTTAVSVTFTSGPGFIYQLQVTSDMADANPWTDLGSPVTADSGTSTTLILDDLDAQGDTQRFYRVVVSDSSSQ